MIHSLKITYKDPAISLDPLGPSTSTQLFLLYVKITMKNYRTYLLASMDSTLSWESDRSRSTPDSSKVSLIAAILTNFFNFWSSKPSEIISSTSVYLKATCLGRPPSSSADCIRRGLGALGGGFNGSGRIFNQLGLKSSLATTPPGNTNALGMNLLRLLLFENDGNINRSLMGPPST